MNKAFTRESDFDDLDEAVPQPRDVLPPGAPNYVTPAGAARVRAELRRLIEVEQPLLEVAASGTEEAVGARDKEIRSKARRALKELKAKIRFLEGHAARFQVVDSTGLVASTVRFGARVTVLDEGGDERTYLICGVDEAEASSGAVSWVSPIAKAVLGREIGEKVSLQLPRGGQNLEIVDIDYE